jgi:hypothetical protein
VLGIVQVVAPVIVFPEEAAPKAVASTLFEDRTNFLQVNNWDGIAGNHRVNNNQDNIPISSNMDEIKLTPELNSKSGYLWNTQSVSLNRDFSISASYYFGSKDADGADFISFILRPLDSWPNDGILNSTSSVTESTGFIQVTFDTYQNDREITQDHLQVISVNSSGSYKNFTDNGTTVGVRLKNTSGGYDDNVERNPSEWFDYTISWSESTNRLTVYAGANANTEIYSTEITTAQQDLVNLNWGWVAATGGANNNQSLRNVVYHYQPVITTSPSDVTVSAGSSVTLNANYSVTGNAQNGRWEYQDYGSTSWTTTSEASISYTFTPTRAQTLRKYRYYIESNLNGLTYSSTSSAATITVIPTTTETDTAMTGSGTTYGYTTVAGANELTPSSSDDFTVAAWIRPTSTCNTRCTIIAREDAFRLTVYQGRFSFVLWNGAGNFTWKDLNFATFPLNQWTHIAITRSGTTVKVYMNGIDIATYTMTYSPAASNTALFYIGNYTTTGTGEPFVGSIDEVKIWKSNRGADLATDMNSNSATTTSMLAYWNFNEGRERIAYNQVLTRSSGTDMTLYSNSYWDSKVISEESATAAYTIRTFKRSYITAAGGWRAPANVTQFHTLVVAGGGAGGRADSTAYEAGGGGGGGVLTTKVALTPQTIYSVQVGYGGIGEINTPTNGGDSVAFSLTAFGGGYGGYATGVGGSGGSGGGGTHNGTNGGTGVVGQGFAGQKPASAGWGGGGGGATGTPTDGKGGVGLTSNITGSNFVYGDGGGGGSYNGVSNLIGGSGNGGRGASAINNGGSNAVTNSGGGGGGAYSSSSGYKGGNGGTGVVIIRWITAAKPIFTQPTIDTTTAGLTDTITVSANPATSLTRNYLWQSSNDTGTTWANISVGTGSGITTQTYTTPVLETSTGGIRYQYRVVVTDSDTVGLFITDTSVAVYIVVNPRITFSGAYTSQKYGSTDSDTFTVTNGTGNKSFTYSPGNRPGITWSSPSTNTAVVSVAATVSVGTYVETITATDTKGAQTQFAVSVVVTKADTITVTALARSDTYTGSVLNFIPSFTVVGLKNSDTATPSYYNYAGADNAGTSYGSTSTKPMNAGTYSITPVTATSLLDSYTAVTIETATLTIYRATRSITVSAPASPMKYGETRTVTATVVGGAGDGTITYATSTTDSCTVSSSTARAIKPSGTCSFTATISQGNNYLAATSSSGSTTLAKADTLTVQVRNPVEMVYTGSAPVTLPTVTVVGLAHTDAATATRLYSAPASAVGAPQSYVALTNSPSFPVDVETYTVSSDFNFTSGSSANYVNIVYETSTVKITRAAQPALTMNLYGAIAGSPFLVVTNGGAGPGAITESVTAGGTALNCTVSNRTLSNTSPSNELKTCNILITKGISRNYFSQSLSATVYFMPYVINQEAQPAASTGLGLTGKTSLTIDTTTPPVITSLSTYSAARSTQIEINGSGFSAGSLIVKFWRNQLGGTPVSVTDSKITIVIPAGATTGKVFVGTVNGETFSELSLVITP